MVKQIPEKELLTIEYFIEKFEAIPEDQWCVGRFVNEAGQKSALGHCGHKLERVVYPNGYSLIHRRTPESSALEEIFNKNGMMITAINDGHGHIGPTPKERVLTALRSLKST